jgi:hypothetical protein
VGKENPVKNIQANTQKMLLENKVNQEIYDKCKSPDNVTIIKVYTLVQLGHVVRMDGKRTAKKLLEGKPERRRKKGTLRLRQRNDTELDLRNKV